MSTYKVYFLIKQRKPIYIGHTKNLRTRIPSHRDKDYDLLKWFVCKDKATALEYEKRWQRLFKPEHNVNGTDSPRPIIDRVKFERATPKSIKVTFTMHQDEYDRLCRFAKNDQRTPGNYLSWCAHRGMRNDTFILERFSGKKKFVNLLDEKV